MKKKKIYEGEIIGLSVYEGKIEGKHVQFPYSPCLKACEKD